MFSSLASKRKYKRKVNRIFTLANLRDILNKRIPEKQLSKGINSF